LESISLEAQVLRELKMLVALCPAVVTAYPEAAGKHSKRSESVE
jgi:hypothetical protein